MDLCNQCGSEIPELSNFCCRCGLPSGKEESDPLIGRSIGSKYRVSSLLGAGAMGCIYQADHLALDRRVAIKVLHPHLVHHKSLVQRFLREARAASRLSHPNIVTLLDFGQEAADGLLYLVMEHLEGLSLQEVMNRDAPIELRRLLMLGRQILLALDEAHENDVVHRDLKPENIIVIPSRQQEEVVKVVDFGLAQMVGGDGPRLTDTGMICGTPSYISPEQARSPDVGPLSDIYSMGVILYEMATGVLPFNGESIFEMVSQHLTATPVNPSELVPHLELPADFCAVILRSLEKEPESRFAGAMAMCEALERSLGPWVDTGRAARREALQTGAAQGNDPAAQHRESQVPRKTEETPLERADTPGAAEHPDPGGHGSRCPICSRAMPPGANFCGECGTSMVNDPELCHNCGVPTPIGGHTCRVCGANLVDEPEEARAWAGDLLGREQELSDVRAACRDASVGRGAAMIICGEDGIGKSALLAQSCEMARSAGLRTHLVRIHAVPPETSVFRELLVRLIDGHHLSSAEQIRSRLAELTTGGLDQDALTDLIDLIGRDAAHHEVLVNGRYGVSMRALLRMMAAKIPVAILVDDVQILSAAEQALLSEVASATQGISLLVLMTSSARPAKGAALAGIRQLPLGPLHPDDATQLLMRKVGDRQIDPETLQRVIESSVGNPLCLLETAEFLDTRGQLTPDKSRRRRRSTQSIIIPGGMRSLLKVKIDGLSDEAVEALGFVAVVGQACPVDLLAQLVDSGDNLLQLIEQLIVHGIVEEAPQAGVRQLGFRHELVRQLALEFFPPEQLRLKHHAVAEALLRGVDEGAAPSEIMEHLALAGQGDRAKEIFEDAGLAQLGQGNISAAIGLIEFSAAARAREVNEAQDGGEGLRRLLTLRNHLAGALNMARREDEAKALALSVRNDALHLGEIAIAAEASLHLGRAAMAQDDVDLARPILEEAYQAAQECGESGLGSELARELGTVRERAGDLDQARAILEEALDRLMGSWRKSRISQELVASSKVAEVCDRLGELCLRTGETEEALDRLTEAYKHAELARDPRLEARILGNLGRAQAAAGDVEAGGRSLRRALALARDRRDQLSEARLLQIHGRVLMESGDHVGARTLFQESVDLSVKIGWKQGGDRGDVLLKQAAGDAEEASR